MFERVGLLGLGLMGGSLALGLRDRGLASVLVGCDSSDEALEAARACGAFDRVSASPAEVVAEADLVVLAVPVLAAQPLLRELAPVLAPGAVLTDVGSVKQPLVTAAIEVLGDACAQLVPGHPIAGSEHSGLAAARADLFIGARVLLTPLTRTAQGSIAAVEKLWRDLGAVPERMEVAEHDELLALTSHLPHLLSYALVDALLENPGEMAFDYAAGGFRDFSRLASSDPVMWRDIVLANPEQILGGLDRYQLSLQRLRGLIASGDGAGLQALFAEVRTIRNAHYYKVDV